MDRSPVSPAPAQPKRYLSPQEFSQLSGLSLATIHRYLNSGKVPFVQPGGPRSRILIPCDALETATTAASAMPSSPIAANAAPETPPPSTPHRLSGPRPRWAREGTAPTTKKS